MADEFIYIDEINDGIATYIRLLNQCSTLLPVAGSQPPAARNR
jgi:hypothetical protein